MYFRNYRLWKTWLDHSPKSAVSEHALTVNMWKRPKYLRKLHKSTFIMFFIILREIDFENVSPSVRWNRWGVCEHIDIRWQVSCSRLWEFGTPNSNAIIWKTKIFLWSFRANSGFYIKFWTLWKKRWLS